MEKLCKNCKHWINNWRWKDSWGVCGLAGSDSGAADHEQSLAWASGFEQYGAELNTREDFGCVQFEAKP